MENRPILPLNIFLTMRGRSPNGESFPPSRMNPSPAPSFCRTAVIVLYVRSCGVAAASSGSWLQELVRSPEQRPESAESNAGLGLGRERTKTTSDRGARRMSSASLCVSPRMMRPLMERTRSPGRREREDGGGHESCSPFLTLASLSAMLPEMILCTC